MKLLKELYLAHSPSGKEDKISKIVCRELKKLNINFSMNGKQIYNLYPDTPLICAHMDQVGKTPITEVYISLDKSCIFANGNLGADDKNGVWILLKLLEKFKDKVSFIFSTGEENGCDIDDILLDEEKAFDSIQYGLIFDRNGNTDIIGSKNDYCTEDFEFDLWDIADEFGYFPERGSLSDCNCISCLVSCVNLSCGYYQAHTDKEFTVVTDLIKALDLGKVLLSNLHGRYDPPNKRWNRLDRSKKDKNSTSINAKNYSRGNYVRILHNGKWLTREEIEAIKKEENEKEKKKNENTTVFMCENCDTTYTEDQLIGSHFDKDYDGFCPSCMNDDSLIEMTTSSSEKGKFCPACGIFVTDDDSGDICPICSSVLLKDLTVDPATEKASHKCLSCGREYCKEEADLLTNCPSCNSELMEYNVYFCDTCACTWFEYELDYDVICPDCGEEVLLLTDYISNNENDYDDVTFFCRVCEKHVQQTKADGNKCPHCNNPMFAPILDDDIAKDLMVI